MDTKNTRKEVSTQNLKNMLIFAVAMKSTELMVSSRNANKQELSNFIFNKIAQPYQKV